MPADKEKVLVVDDEKAYLDDFLSLFSRKFNILTANSGEEGLQLLEKEPVAVIVSDQRMPGMTGSDFLAEASKKVPETVRILLTGYADLDAVISAVNKGEIYRYISKDTPLKEIEIVIRQGLERFRMEETNRQLLRAKKRLLKSLAIQENLSVVGTLGQQIHQRLEALTMNLFNYVFQMGKEKDENVVMAEFQRLQGALSKLRELSSFSQALSSSGMEERDINPMVEEASAKAKQAALATGGAMIQVELGKGIPPIPVHGYSFDRLLKELLEDALLFNTKRGEARKIRVKTSFHEAPSQSGEESLVQIEIEDNGAGIPASEIPKTFAPFYSSFQTMDLQEGKDPPPPEAYNLTSQYHYGFGLPIAQWIACLRHGGMIELKSEVGKGTTATVSIPVRK